MERSESYYFFTLLNLYKKRLKYDHHKCFLRTCGEKNIVAKGLRLKKNANISSARRVCYKLGDCFDFGSPTRTFERETKLTVQRLTADIVNIKTSIVERYGPQRAGELKNKVIEVSEHFKDHLQHRWSKKLDFFYYLLSRKFYTEYFTVFTIIFLLKAK